MNTTVQTFPETAVVPAKGRVKLGFDPTFSRLHLGHWLALRFARSLFEAGHPLTIVLGTFTAQLGDPSGRDAMRPILSPEEVERNAEAIISQLRQLMPSGVEFWKNGTVHNEMKLPEFMKLASRFTVTFMTGRNSFRKRALAGDPVGLHELLVPVCQAFDSVVLKTEIEIGGQDQLFNFQVTRQMQIDQGLPPQVSLLLPIVNGRDGNKMSKSLNNCIFLDEAPEQMFGQIMSVSDALADEWFPLFVDGPAKGPDMMQNKKDLAFALVSQLHGDAAADVAQRHFESTVQEGEVPEIVPEIVAANLCEAVAKARKCSNSEARRLIAAGGVTVDGKKETHLVPVKPGQLIKVGKRVFCRIAA